MYQSNTRELKWGSSLVQQYQENRHRDIGKYQDRPFTLAVVNLSILLMLS